MREQPLNLLPVLPPVPLLDLRQLGHVAGGVLQPSRRLPEMIGPMAGGRNRAEQIGLGLALLGYLILRRAELGLRRRQGRPVAIDLRTHRARQRVQARE